MQLVIILITYNRTDYALRTIAGIVDYLKFSGDISWYVCDDDSQADHYQTVLNFLKGKNQHICGHHSQKLGYGGGVNKAWRVASQTSPVTLWLEDDWELREDFNIDPYVELLNGRNNIGMIRLGHMPKGQKIEIVGHDGIVYGLIDKNPAYAFSGNPHLKHDRFMLIYGDYPRDRGPGDTETTYDYIVRNKDGPQILWPLSIGDGYKFHHIGTVTSYDN